MKIPRSRRFGRRFARPSRRNRRKASTRQRRRRASPPISRSPRSMPSENSRAASSRRRAPPSPMSSARSAVRARRCPSRSGRAKRASCASTPRRAPISSFPAPCRVNASGSLLAAIDRCATGAGSRLLAARLASPLVEPAAIGTRLDAVAYFIERPELRAEIRARLRRIPDILRALTRIALDRGGPRDLAAIGQALEEAQIVALALAKSGTEASAELDEARQSMLRADPALARQIAAALADELPLLKRDGGFVRQGHDAALDETRALRDESRRVIAALQTRYAEEADCRTLRIKHNNMLGFFVEVPQSAGERFLKEPLGRHLHASPDDGGGDALLDASSSASSKAGSLRRPTRPWRLSSAFSRGLRRASSRRAARSKPWRARLPWSMWRPLSPSSPPISNGCAPS